MDSIVLENERHLRVGVAEARTSLVRALRSMEFTLTTEQVSMIGAKRGSQLAGSVQPKKLPITVKITLQPGDDGCQVTIRIADAWRSGVGKVWGMNNQFRTVIDEVQRELDEALAAHAAAGAAFDNAELQTSTRDIRLLSASNDATARVTSAAGNKVEALLDGPKNDGTPKALKEVVLRSSKGVASFDRANVAGLFTVGLLVSTKPGAMPANLARDVEEFSAKLENAVARQPQGRVVVEVGDDEIPVAEFLGKQAEIRMALPLRTLQVCTTCKLEKVVNPDFKKLQERNQRKRVLTGAVGATVTSSGISPFLAIGSLIKLKNFDIPFVCNRCQGLEADTSIVTYCPQCGERRGEAVLRICPRCKYNFTADHHAHDHDHEHDHPAEFWLPEPARPAQIAFAAPMPVASAAPPPLAAPSAAPLAAPTFAAAPPAPTVAPMPLPAPTAHVAFAAPAVAGPAAGWYPDTTHRHQMRYWDGSRWTEHVADNGHQGHDPV